MHILGIGFGFLFSILSTNRGTWRSSVKSMKTFVFILKSKRRDQLTQGLLMAHGEHLQNLLKGGSLVICGPFQDNDQAMQILRAESKESAISLFQTDPFIRQKYYQDFEIHELLEANESNNWLIDSAQTKNNSLGPSK